MIARHTLTYVGARGLAAALDMGSLAVVTRLAPVATYGRDRRIRSWARALRGACQWPTFAVVARSGEACAGARVGAVLGRLAGALGLVAGRGAAALPAAVAARVGIPAPTPWRLAR